MNAPPFREPGAVESGPRMKYGVLAQRNPEYRADIWSELDDLYEGGYAVTRKAKTYLPALVGEHPARCEERRKSAGYLGYLGMIIDRFVAALFMQDLVVTEPGDAKNPNTVGGTSDTTFWGAFAKDADMGGTSFAQMMRAAMRTALLKQKAVIAIDFPAPDANAEDAQALAPLNRAEEDAAGLSRGYLIDVPVEQLIDWKVDRFGNFLWARLYRIFDDVDSPYVMRDATKIHEFKVWRMEGGRAVWETWQFVERNGIKPTNDSELERTGGDVTTFDRIPLVRVELPPGLWVGNLVGTVQREHHSRRTCLVSSMNRSLVAIPVAKLGSEIGAAGGPMPSEVQSDPNRGHDPVGQFQSMGFVVIGAGDDITFAEPSGGAYTITREDLADLKDEMFRVVHQMAASLAATPSSAGASGDSKREDREAECVVLTALGKVVRDTAKLIYDLIARARGERVVWVVHGLDQFESDDRGALLTEAVQVDQVAIPSDTFRKEYKTRIAMKLLESAPPETQDVIRQEIDDGVTSEAEMRDLRRDVEKQQLQNPEQLGGAAATVNRSAPPAQPQRNP